MHQLNLTPSLNALNGAISNIEEDEYECEARWYDRRMIFLLFSITEPHLLVILSKWGADWIFVNSLYNTYDFSITVADGHTEDGLSLVPGQLVNLITEAVILELWLYKHTGYYIFIDWSPH